MEEINFKNTGEKYVGSVDTTTVKVGDYILDVRVTGIKGDKGDQGDKGDKGDTIKISDVKRSIGVTQVTFDDGTSFMIYDGEKGDTGPMGPQGIQGEDGPQGIPGDKGDKGDKGEPGDDGKSAYEIYKESTYNPLTEEEWLESLKGEKGDKGDSVIPNPEGESTEELTKLKIGDSIYELKSNKKIFDSNEDTQNEGKLSNYPDGKLSLTTTTKYNSIEVYYSENDTSMIQSFKITTEPLLVSNQENKKNVGMFYIFSLDNKPLVYLEHVTVEYDEITDSTYKITITSNVGSNSNVKIESVWGEI